MESSRRVRRISSAMNTRRRWLVAAGASLPCWSQNGLHMLQAMASSTAIETGQPVAEIERALTDRQSTQATPA
jgi:hypothetical protein